MVRSKLLIVLVLSAVTLLLGFLCIKASRPVFQTPTYTNYFIPDSEYHILPSNSSALISDNTYYYPTVQTPPTSKKYKLVLLREYASVKKYKNGYMFLASKRIPELQTWGSGMQILGSIKDANELSAWWKRNEPNLWEFSKYNRFNSWESTLARYANLVNSYIESLNQEPDLTKRMKLYNETQTELRGQRRDIEEAIYTKNILSSNKIYLLELTNSVFRRLNARLERVTGPFSELLLKYPLIAIDQDREFANYTLSVPLENIPPYFDNQGEFILDHTIKSSEPILIDRHQVHTNTITLQLPQMNLLPNQQWQQELSQKGEFSYYLELPSYDTSIPYGLKLTYPVTGLLTLQLERTYNRTRSNFIFDDRFFLVDGENTYQKTFAFPRGITSSNRLILHSDQPLDFTKLHVELFPLWEPIITLQKVSTLPNYLPSIQTKQISNTRYSLITQNTTHGQDLYIRSTLQRGWTVEKQNQLSDSMQELIVTYKPFGRLGSLFVISLISLMLVIYFFILKPDTRFSTPMNLTKSKYIASGITVANQVLRIIHKVTIPIALLIAASIFFDVFRAQQYSQSIVLGTMTLWVLFVIITKVEARVSFSAGLFFLILGPVFLSRFHDLQAEKAAIWGYMFITVGMIEILIAQKRK